MAGAAVRAFDFDGLRERARALAAQPQVEVTGELPAWQRQLTYDDLRPAEFDGRESLWRPEQLPFQVQFIHPGFLFDRTVKLFEVRSGAVQPIPFRREYFTYRTPRTGDLPTTLGFAGFRVMYPLNGAGTPPLEIGSFARVTYFRFLGAGTAYGLSARGLAVNPGEPTPEEFPRFREFWLERMAPGAQTMNVYALLDSETVAGAYHFAITPGRTTVMQVRAVIYCRSNPKVFGLAPLNSMFWHGENSDTARDFRPEVHDSDGLLM